MKSKRLASVMLSAVVAFATAAVVMPAQVEAASTGRVAMYRLYNPNSGEHFYTKTSSERDGLKRVGWKDEGEGWTAPQSSNTPVYRLYNPNAGDHHYTTAKAEHDNLVTSGWKSEGIGWYSDDAKAIPVYREYNPNAVTGTHNYTTNKSEHNKLVSLGWRDEGIGWYGVSEEVPLNKITLSETSVSLETGDTKSLKVSYDPADYSGDKTVTWVSSDTSVATVNNSGVVTAVSAGNATITASVSGKTASCKVKVTAKTEEFSIGETWTVPGQWRFRVDSVEKHYACNSRSKATGEEVVLIHYTYWNDGYEGWNNKNGVFFSGFNVYDSKGVAAETYPCTHDTLPKEAIKGTSCSASQAYILKNAGRPITVYVSNYTYWNGEIGDNESAIFKLDEGGKDDNVLNKISLSETSVELKTGETKSLKVSYDPADYSGDKTVTWTSSNASVATVNNSGVVTAVSAGNATITASVSGKTANCKVEVTAKIEEFSIGETWTVPGQWRFRVDSVEKHYACNRYSNQTGEEVVIINYTYWNDGYEKNLYFSSFDFSVYDSTGVAAETYPCTHDTDPKELIKGASCSAGQAYILKNAGRPITLSVSKYSSTNGKLDSKMSAIFKLGEGGQKEPEEPSVDTDTGFEKVKKYVTKNGEKNDNYYKYEVDKGEHIFTISCGDDYLIFMDSFMYNGMFVASSVLIEENNDVSAAGMRYSMNDTYFDINAGIYNKTYDAAKDTLSFSYQGGRRDIYDSMDQSTLNDVSNSTLKSSFVFWNAMLSTMGTNMNEVAYPCYSGL